MYIYYSQNIDIISWQYFSDPCSKLCKKNYTWQNEDCFQAE